MRVFTTGRPAFFWTQGNACNLNGINISNTMKLTTESITVSRGLSYSYVHIPPARSRPYVLILHGFPSLPVDFHRQITHLSMLGYGILVPELLGYGDTSHPDNKDAYRLRFMTADVVDILDHLKIAQVLGLGHDWGATLLTRLEFYYPDRVAAMTLLTIGATPLGQPFDLDTVMAMMKDKLGYEGYGYMAFFTRDHDAAHILNTHQESFRSLMYQTDAELCKQYLGNADGLKSWLLDNRKTKMMKSFTDQLRQEHEVAFSIEKGGYAGTLKWYESLVSQNNVSDEKAELQKRGLTAYQTTKSLLQILATNDPIAIAPIHQQMTESYAPKAKFKSFNTGHWVMLEATDAVNDALERFFDRF